VLLKAQVERSIQARFDAHGGAPQARANIGARDVVNLGMEVNGVVD